MPRLLRKVPRRHRATNPVQARHQTLPSVSSATLATQMAVGCLQAPRLPRKWQVDVAECHTCHAKCRGVTARPTRSKARHQTLPSVSSATPATQMAVGCLQVPRLPHKWQVDVAECHACHAKCRRVTARPIRSKRATRPSPVSTAPRLARKWQLDVAECHACHANGRWMSPSATPATQSAAASPRCVTKMVVDKIVR